MPAYSGETTTVMIGSIAHVDQFTPGPHTVHVVHETRDNGTPKLTGYRRAIITVPGASERSPMQGCAVPPVPPSH